MKLQNLSFRHSPTSPLFFENLSFELEEGRLHALHGKNGVGKSILLHLLGGKRPPHSLLTGELPFGSVELLTQQFDQTLAPPFSFLENLSFSRLSRFPNPFSPLPKHPPLFTDLFNRFHIDPHLPVSRLSGGQRQLLALLMKLQRNPRLLLLDEPTSALDEQNAALVFEFLATLKGVTLLIVCHDAELIHHYATGRHLHLEKGADGIRRLKS